MLIPRTFDPLLTEICQRLICTLVNVILRAAFAFAFAIICDKDGMGNCLREGIVVVVSQSKTHTKSLGSGDDQRQRTRYEHNAKAEV